MSEVKKIRPCPTCKSSLFGVNVGSDEDWHVFNCEPCEEEWGENTKYCVEQLEQAPELV